MISTLQNIEKKSFTSYTWHSRGCLHALIFDNALDNIREMTKGGIHTSSWDEEYNIVRKDICNG